MKPDSESEQETNYWPDGQKKTKICEQSEPWSDMEFETESDEELNGMFSLFIFSRQAFEPLKFRFSEKATKICLLIKARKISFKFFY